jgi:hypothetical protein
MRSSSCAIESNLLWGSARRPSFARSMLPLAQGEERGCPAFTGSAGVSPATNFKNRPVRSFWRESRSGAHDPACTEPSR